MLVRPLLIKMLPLLLFFLALFLRVYQLDQTTIYPDEITWMVRGKETVSALKKLDLGFFNNAWWHRPEAAEAIALPEVVLIGASMALIGKDQSNFSLNLTNEVLAARLPIAILNSLLIPLFYLFAKNYFSSQVSFLAALLLALDPIHLALSRWVMLDGVLTVFTFSAVFCFLFITRSNLKVTLASLSLMLAFLTKPAGILAAFSWITYTFLEPVPRKPKIKLLLISLTLFFFLVWLFWLGEWQKPVTAMIDYTLHQKQLTQKGYNILFFGTITNHPPIYYYLPQIIFRLPLTTIFLILSVILLFFLKKFSLKKIKSKFFTILSLSIFPLSYLVLISLSGLKLGVRYALPLWPWIYFLAAWGLQQVFLKQKLKVFLAISTILVFSSIITYQKYLPDFYFFYNSLIGGPSQAQKYDLVGHCISTKPALEYLQINYPQIKSVAILGCSNVTAPYYFNGKITTNWKSEKAVIIESTYFQLLPDNPEVKYFKNLKPIFEVKVQEAVLAKVYLNNTPKDTSKN